MNRALFNYVFILCASYGMVPYYIAWVTLVFCPILNIEATLSCMGAVA